LAREIPSRWTSGPGAEYGPAWSPDGKWIAFLGQQERSTFGVSVIAPVGGTPRKVAETPSPPLGVLGRPYRRLDWTRDSRHLIVSAFDGRTSRWERLLLVSVDTGEKTWLTGLATDVMSGDREPAVSPDGSMVAFARRVLGNETLHVLPLATDLGPAGARGQSQPPARRGARRGCPTDGRWSSQLTTLKTGVITGFALSWIDLDSGKPPRHLVALGSNATTPAVSRRGRLAYSTVSAEGNI
jgi:WD40-like Beta Propeller Repeat